MKVVVFTPSLVSDWNHGSAHFIRGVVTELQERGHEVAVYEPADGWSRRRPRPRRGKEFAAKLRASGLETIRARHTCAHRVDELLAIDAELRGAPALLEPTP